jgi:N-acetylneuraminic acid mutarotase
MIASIFPVRSIALLLFLMFTVCVLSVSGGQVTISSSSSTAQSFWATGAPMPSPRSEIAGAILDSKIYIIGGFDESGRSSTTVDLYDPIIDKWTSATPLPLPLDHSAATSHDGKLYVVGGGYLNRDDLSNKLFIYDHTSNKWTEGANLPTARGALTAKGFCMR